MSGVRYPKVKVRLTGRDSNAYFILGTVEAALHKAGVSPKEIAEYTKEATSGDYDNLLRVTTQRVSVR